MINTFSQSQPFDDDDGDDHTQETTPGGDKQIQWKVVAKMPGLLPAQIVAGRLQAEGIPARAWQEGAGQAIGLTVGLLGTGFVIVPDTFEAQALAILDETEGEWED